MNRQRSVDLNRRHLSPRFTGMMEFMHADTPLVKASGCYFWDANGRRYLDFMSGFSALSLGHNHPRIQDALRQVAEMPVMLVSPLIWDATAERVAALMVTESPLPPLPAILN